MSTRLDHIRLASLRVAPHKCDVISLDTLCSKQVTQGTTVHGDPLLHFQSGLGEPRFLSTNRQLAKARSLSDPHVDSSRGGGNSSVNTADLAPETVVLNVPREHRKSRRHRLDSDDVVTRLRKRDGRRADVGAHVDDRGPVLFSQPGDDGVDLLPSIASIYIDRPANLVAHVDGPSETVTLAGQLHGFVRKQ